MESGNSFFANLFRLKQAGELNHKIKKDEFIKDEVVEKQVDYEWLQEYELIYRSYAIDSH